MIANMDDDPIITTTHLTDRLKTSTTNSIKKNNNFLVIKTNYSISINIIKPKCRLRRHLLTCLKEGFHTKAIKHTLCTPPLLSIGFVCGQRQVAHAQLTPMCNMVPANNLLKHWPRINSFYLN